MDIRPPFPVPAIRGAAELRHDFRVATVEDGRIMLEVAHGEE